jgi:hypothetical protein
MSLSSSGVRSGEGHARSPGARHGRPLPNDGWLARRPVIDVHGERIHVEYDLLGNQGRPDPDRLELIGLGSPGR